MQHGVVHIRRTAKVQTTAEKEKEAANAPIAQRLRHLPYKQEILGSSPSGCKKGENHVTNFSRISDYTLYKRMSIRAAIIRGIPAGSLV